MTLLIQALRYLDLSHRAGVAWEDPLAAADQLGVWQSDIAQNIQSRIVAIYFVCLRQISIVATRKLVGQVGQVGPEDSYRANHGQAI